MVQQVPAPALCVATPRGPGSALPRPSYEREWQARQDPHYRPGQPRRDKRTSSSSASIPEESVDAPAAPPASLHGLEAPERKQADRQVCARRSGGMQAWGQLGQNI